MLPRPKILTAIEIPSTYTFAFSVSNAGSYDTPLSFTIAAGTYYMAWDAQDDDLVYVINLGISTAISAALGLTNREVSMVINTSNKIEIKFSGTNFHGTPKNNVKLRWTASTAALVKLLGFDPSSDDSSAGVDAPTFTSDYQHSHGWYADEDGYLEWMSVEDMNIIKTPQAISYSGFVKSQLMGSRYRNELRLQYLTRARTWSAGVGYSEAAVWPYDYNVPLECWWQEARKGRQFRVYEYGYNDSTAALVSSAFTSSNSTTATDTSQSWQVSPSQKYKHQLAYLPDVRGASGNQATRFRIESHTATVLTAPNTPPNAATSWAPEVYNYYIIEGRYRTYVVDLSEMSAYEPTELDQISRFNIAIPLLRYES